MFFDNIDWDKKYDFTLITTKKNEKPIAILKEAFNRSLERNLDTFDKLTFDIPYYIEDAFTHQQIKNPNYDKIFAENLVLLKCGDDINNPMYSAYFIIKNVEEDTERMLKHVECTSREVVLNKNIITLDGVTRQLYSDNVNVADGVFNFLESETYWNLGHLDPNAKTESINGGTSNKYRWFDAFSKPWYQFLQEDVQSSFNVVLKFNTLDKTVDVYDRATYGTHTGILLSEENYIKNLKKQTKTENLVTKLEITGRDGMTIDGVNIYGTTYILNYDYFKQNGQMSSELVDALEKYEELVTQKDTQYDSLRSQLNTLNATLITKQGQLDTYEEELVALRHIQTAYMSSGDNTNLPTATTNVNNKIAQINSKQAEITTLEGQIDAINEQLSDIANDIKMENARLNNVLIFNDSLLEELEEFTYTESWETNYYNNAEQLYRGGEDTLKDWSVPTIEFSLDMVDFFSVAQAQNYWGKIKLGDLVRIYSGKFNTNVDVRIVAYSYDIDSNSLSMTFSNKDKKLDDTRGISSTIRRASEASRLVNVRKLEWNDIKNTRNAVNTFLNNALDTARQRIISQVGRNKINIDENGIFIIDADNEDNQVALLSGVIAFTSDGWDSCNTALDNEGIYAQYLVGQVILGEKLFIQDETGQFNITGSLLTIKDDQNNVRVRLGKYATSAWGLQILSKNGGQVILDENGLLSQYTMAMAENVDENHPLKFKFYIPDNMISVYKINLAFTLEAYRAYETGAANGGGGSQTSASGGGSQETTDTKTFVLLSFMTGVPENTIGTENWGYHLHNVQIDGDRFEHSHGVSIPSHTHNVSIPSHTHGLVYKIIEGTTAQNVCVYVDGTLRDGSNYNTNQNDINLTQYITTSGWHEISLTSSQNGRLSASLYVSMFLGA